MGRQVSHDGMGGLQVRFPYDRALVELVKTLPQRRWNAAERYWFVPETDVVPLVDLLHAHGFAFDRATRELYSSMGGRAELAPPAAPRSAGPLLPGLFDTSETDDAARESSERPASRLGAETDLTVSELNERVRGVIEAAFPAPLWLIGEISGFNKSAHRRHVTFELAERAEDGRALSRIPAVLFSSTREAIEGALRQAGDPFRIEDEVTVRVRVTVGLYVPWGQYRAVLEEIDVRYTLGEAARRREEIVRRLTLAGLVERNRQLPLPPLPLRVGLITSLGSDAYNDALRTLQESGLAFRITAHGARVQGHATEPSVLNALDWFRARADRFDVVLICRGGGARTDLVWFDSETLGRAVALFPLPVVVGIGHEQDQSVLDAVARSCRTPTAAAGLLVDTVERSVERLEGLAREILERCARTVREERQRGRDHARRLVRASRNLLRHERSVLDHRRRRSIVAARTMLAAARDRLARWSALIPRDARLQLERQRQFLGHALRSLQQGARRDLHGARERVERLARGLRPRATLVLGHERERVELRQRRLRLVDPRRVLERGYSILRLDDGRVLTRAEDAPSGSPVQAELRHGGLRLRSEGRAVVPTKGGGG